MRESCGTYTASPYNRIRGQCVAPYSSIGNFCTEQLNYFSSDHYFKNERTLRAAVMFVFVDCDTLAPSPDEKQDPGWIHDGVRLPRDNGALINAYETFWKQNDDSFEATSDSSICNSDQHPTPPAYAYAYANATDFEGAIMDLMDNGANSVPGGNPSPDVTVATDGSCAIKVVYDEQWKDGCEVNFLEVAAGAQAIIDSCTDWDDETTGCNHFVRKTGNCGCHVRFQSRD